MRASRRVSVLFPLFLVSGVLAHYGVHGDAAPAAQPSPQATRSDAERRAHMQEHFSQVMTVHEAVIRGDVASATAPALWLTNHEAPKSLPAGSAPFVAQMQRAARRTADASSVLEAALGTADMLKTCGDCHRAMGTMPAVAIQPPRPEVHGLVGHMLAHQQAADQMLQGLVVPSSALWRTGAGGLQTAPLRPATLPSDRKLSRSLVASEKRLHALASQASRAEDPAARAVFYGQILSRCADCHALHPGIWGPTRRQ
jgi:hypothetical protein